MTASNPDYITLYDIKRCGYCMAGAREWCKKRDYPFRDLVKIGYPVALAETLDDSIVQHILRVKRGQIDG